MAGRHFSFLKRAGRHKKGAGRRALQKRPRQNTVKSYFKVPQECSSESKGAHPAHAPTPYFNEPNFVYLFYASVKAKLEYD